MCNWHQGKPDKNSLSDPPEAGDHTTNTRRRPSVRVMLAHRLRRWANITLTLGQRLVFASHGQ